MRQKGRGSKVGLSAWPKWWQHANWHVNKHHRVLIMAGLSRLLIFLFLLCVVVVVVVVVVVGSGGMVPTDVNLQCCYQCQLSSA